MIAKSHRIFNLSFSPSLTLNNLFWLFNYDLLERERDRDFRNAPWRPWTCGVRLAHPLTHRSPRYFCLVARMSHRMWGRFSDLSKHEKRLHKLYQIRMANVFSFQRYTAYYSSKETDWVAERRWLGRGRGGGRGYTYAQPQSHIPMPLYLFWQIVVVHSISRTHRRIEGGFFLTRVIVFSNILSLFAIQLLSLSHFKQSYFELLKGHLMWCCVLACDVFHNNTRILCFMLIYCHPVHWRNERSLCHRTSCKKLWMLGYVTIGALNHDREEASSVGQRLKIVDVCLRKYTIFDRR